jgi:UrcA family protein
MFRTAAFSAALAAAAMVSFPAHAQEAGKSTEVHYADLNLASVDGAQTLKDRVARAAQRVCAVDGDKSLEGVMQARHCSKVAVARAMPQVELALANAGTQVAGGRQVSVATR